MKRLTPYIVALFLAGSAAAQSQPQVQTPSTPDLTVTVDLVNLLFPVVDNKGKFITNLKQQDFRVYEDNRLQTISTFSSESDLALSIALLVDNSGSVRTQLKFEQDAAIWFFQSTLKYGKDKAIVVSFDTIPRLMTPEFTDNGGKLTAAIEAMTVGGGSSLYDALASTAEKLSEEKGRRVIILIGDGDDNQSRILHSDALEILQKNDVTVYAISTNSVALTGGKDKNDDILRKTADDTGGRAFFPKKLEELASKFKEVGEELRVQYSLSYRPTNTKLDGTFRKVRVDVVNKDLKAKTRAGYYAGKAGVSAGK